MNRRDLFVIVGASGDLASRKLLPALYRLSHDVPADKRFRILGVATDSERNDEAFRQKILKEADELAGVKIDQKWLDETLFYQSIGHGGPDEYHALAARVAALEKSQQLSGNRVFYLALPPTIFPLSITRLGEAGLNQSDGWTRLVIEKPFGRDAESAEALNRLVHKYFEEKQVYRIDHYLGKETVQNLLVFRFANSLFEPLWNRDRVESVEIVVAESLGIEHRGRYYDTAGALRDMIQNHLTQLLTLTAMEPPASFEADAIQHEKVKVLKSIRPIGPGDVVFGQYARGEIDGKPVPSYRQEPDVAPDSHTETFVAMRLRISNWRWQGVPFYLRTGKRLPSRVSRILVNFRCPPVSLFQPFACSSLHPNALMITIQPDEGFDVQFEVKTPGLPFRVVTQNLHFRYSEAFEPSPEAYETLLLDVLLGDATQFVRDDWVEASWRLYTPILETPPTIALYPAGNWGPKEAERLSASPLLGNAAAS
ncbi:MAG: glucose-6-phosphate dehydrogenase [Acidobacteriota bacterium]|nr:glucose-6-phosphate dehydrogenase [Acidobacteriota bacterium]